MPVNMGALRAAADDGVVAWQPGVIGRLL